MVSRSKKRKLRKEAEKRLGDGLRTLESHGMKVGFNTNPPSQKMSEVLLDFAGPYLPDYGDAPEAYKGILSIAVLVWNMSLISEEEQEKVRADAERLLSASGGEPILGLIDELLARKYRYFEDNTRYIVTYNIQRKRNQITVNVASIQR